MIRVGREVVEGLAGRKLCTLSGLIISYDYLTSIESEVRVEMAVILIPFYRSIHPL